MGQSINLFTVMELNLQILISWRLPWKGIHLPDGFTEWLYPLSDSLLQNETTQAPVGFVMFLCTREHGSAEREDAVLWENHCKNDLHYLQVRSSAPAQERNISLFIVKLS